MDKKLSYDEFIEYCRKNIRTVMGEKDYKTSFIQIEHTDDYVSDGILVENNKGNNISTSIRTKEFYNEYLKGKGLGTIIYEMIKTLECREGWSIPFNLDETLANYDALKSRLIIRAINYNNSKNLLRKNIYTVKDDIALVVYTLIRSSDEGIMSAKIPKAYFHMWNVTKERLFEDAINNTAHCFSPILLDMDIMMILSLMNNDSKLDSGLDFMDASKPCHIKKTMFGVCLTTINKINGATAVFYPGVLERLGKLLNEDFYVVFMSIHEAIIHPLSVTKLESIRGIANNIEKNGYLLNKTEFLSNNVYIYSHKDKQINIV